jgi:poly[(R)-3-hydroxyalkanoate] polymerase subunit PhaC
MGAQPAPFDILFWNSDSTNLPAGLHAGFLDLLLHNSLVHHGTAEILGTPLDLGAISCDLYILAGQTDHICSFKTCYRAANLFGGHTEFVLNSSGHVQSLVCPPDNPKAKYRTNIKLHKQIDKWLETATEHKGSWWDHWLRWLEPRSGERRAAPTALGSRKFPPLEKAPGTYVHDKP